MLPGNGSEVCGLQKSRICQLIYLPIYQLYIKRGLIVIILVISSFHFVFLQALGTICFILSAETLDTLWDYTTVINYNCIPTVLKCIRLFFFHIL